MSLEILRIEFKASPDPGEKLVEEVYNVCRVKPEDVNSSDTISMILIGYSPMVRPSIDSDHHVIYVDISSNETSNSFTDLKKHIQPFLREEMLSRIMND